LKLALSRIPLTRITVRTRVMTIAGRSNIVRCRRSGRPPVVVERRSREGVRYSHAEDADEVWK